MRHDAPTDPLPTLLIPSLPSVPPLFPPPSSHLLPHALCTTQNAACPFPHHVVPGTRHQPLPPPSSPRFRPSLIPFPLFFHLLQTSTHLLIPQPHHYAVGGAASLPIAICLLLTPFRPFLTRSSPFFFPSSSPAVQHSFASSVTPFFTLRAACSLLTLFTVSAPTEPFLHRCFSSLFLHIRHTLLVAAGHRLLVSMGSGSQFRLATRISLSLLRTTPMLHTCPLPGTCRRCGAIPLTLSPSPLSHPVSPFLSRSFASYTLTHTF